MGIWEDSDNSKIFTYTENLYYSLRTKTARGNKKRLLYAPLNRKIGKGVFFEIRGN